MSYRKLISEWRMIVRGTRVVESLSAGIALWWSILLLSPVHLFSTNKAFDTLANIAPERTWGIGVLCLMAVQLTGWLTGMPSARTAGLFCSSIGWAYVAACIGVSAPRYGVLIASTGFGVYGVISISSIWGFCKIAPFVVPDALLFAERVKRQLITYKVQSLCQTSRSTPTLPIGL